MLPLGFGPNMGDDENQRPLIERGMLEKKPKLAAVAVGYVLVVVLGCVGGGFSQALNDAFVALAALFMVCRPAQDGLTRKECVMVLFLFSAIALLTDGMSFLQASSVYPGYQNMFAVKCPNNRTVKLPRNETVTATIDGHTDVYIVPAGRKVYQERDYCSIFWVLRNVALILSILLDVFSTSLSWQMLQLWSIDPSLGIQAGGANMQPPQQLQNMRRGVGQQAQTQQPRGYQPFTGRGQVLSDGRDAT
mmetsp:Transcript_22766/g.36206  ORF Transcript_22766/g.36206 Transcript_22766/m.36206 type:complete len:248 (+) Transcript_22766:59-802(+)